MPHHRQSSVCEGQLLESLAATLVAQLHAVVQQFLFLSQAQVHVGQKCVGREEVCGEMDVARNMIQVKPSPT